MRRRATLTAVTALAIAATAIGTSATAATTSAPRAASYVAPAGTAPVHFTFAGDSLMARGGSWLSLMRDPGLVNDGGVAVSGSTSGQVAAKVTAHKSSSVLVVCVGTNDVNSRATAATINKNLQTIVDRVGAQHVLVLALPPSKITNDRVTHANRQKAQYIENWHLEQYAQSKGWLYADPWSSLRYYSNQVDYAPAYTDDGVHPNTAGVKRVVPVMQNLIREAALGGSR